MVELGGGVGGLGNEVVDLISLVGGINYRVRGEGRDGSYCVT